ncbi:MAG: preprotein translocase subunit SecY [Candidatus Omnitrophica bacterium]|nr:preprotein translocase subunit SecY [Candidatus Omnitrophota bacterium]MCF7891868.1 preprotein translocase subunit SecY [Candidatus Omnitrophota bacterium]MCF7897687.1 preprotein translocase subunit SecY [Candidatus Omnitrophota bacterium]MCF7909475.1 preprotein translocase subunit SecY [Candidatus Omnitrophota bacterium]
MFKAVANIFKVPDLRKKILITLSLLVVYRAGCFIPTPGVNTGALSQFFAEVSKNQGQTIFGMLNLFTGGALTKLSIFALGIMPYISASIIMQLLQNVVPALEKIAKEGKAGYEKINQYTRYFTLVLCFVQGLFLSFWLSNPANFKGHLIVPEPGLLFNFTTVITLACGTIFIMWLGEQIQERGIGNGISIIITTSILSRIPSSVSQLWRLWSPTNPANQQISTPVVIGLVAVLVCMIAAVVLFTQAQRRIPIQYGRRVVGRKMYGGQSTYLPIKIDMAGVIAIIFASAVISFPATLAMFLPKDIKIVQFLQTVIQQRGFWYNFILVGLIIFFMYFYTAMVFHPLEIANNLKRYGGFVPGVRPGRPTANYLDYVATRVVFVGAIYISIIAIFPNIIMEIFRVPSYQLASLFGGTTLLIMVAVILDTMKQVEGQLMTRHYDGFIKGSPLKGRK